MPAPAGPDQVPVAKWGSDGGYDQQTLSSRPRAPSRHRLPSRTDQGFRALGHDHGCHACRVGPAASHLSRSSVDKLTVPTALPGRAEHAPDRPLEPLMRVRDHELHARKATFVQAAQEGRPERLGFRGADVQADDLAPSLGIDCHGDYGGYRDDPAALALLEIGGVEPKIGPRALQGPLQEGVDPLVDVLAQLADRALGDAR